MRKNFFMVLIISFVLLFSYSCKKSENIKAKKRENIAFKVSTEKAKIGDISEYIEYAGVVESFKKINILPEIAGRIKKMYKNIGDSVKKGDLLFELEDTIYKSQYEQAKAGLEAAKISFEDAKKNMERMTAVYKKNGVSKAQYEQAVSAFKLAKSNLERAKAAFKMASFQYNSTKIKAPFSGVITGKLKEEGDFINPSMGGFSQGTGVYVLEDYSKIYVNVNIPNSDSNLIKRGEITDIVSSKDILKGKVYTVNEKTDPMSSSISIKIIADNSEGKVLPGNIVKVRIHYRWKNNALIIPTGAILENNIVFVKKGNIVRERKVKIGLSNPYFTEIVSGISEGDSVVVKGNFGLFDKARVEEEIK